MDRREFIAGMVTATAMALASQARAAGGTLRGVTDDEILMGQTMPYTGPASVYSAWCGKVHLAYCDYINAKGGINGRKLKLLSYDDGYNPSRTIEQVRRLVERDQVAFIFYIFGTAPSEAAKGYLNSRKVPLLFTGTSAPFADPERFPYAMPITANAGIEANILGDFIRDNHAGKKIGVLYQQDDIGEVVRKGLRAGLGDQADLIVSEQPYQITDTTVDSQILTLRSAGVEVLYNAATVKHGVQAAKKMQEIGWEPTTFILNSSTGIVDLMQKSGSRLPKELITTAYFKSPLNHAWDNDPDMLEWRKFMAEFYPDGPADEPFCVLSTVAIQALVHVLTACGDDLSTENIMKVATSMKDVELPMLLPGIRLNTGADDFFPIEDLQVISYDGENWNNVGEVRSAS